MTDFNIHDETRMGAHRQPWWANGEWVSTPLPTKLHALVALSGDPRDPDVKQYGWNATQSFIGGWMVFHEGEFKCTATSDDISPLYLYTQFEGV